MGDRRAEANRNDSNRNNHDPQLPRAFTYPIALDADDDTTMKNISPAFLPTFCGLSSEDPDQFIFEFKVLCQTYDYKNDNQKLKLFPSTLKDLAMRWFMGLLTGSITSWEEMETVFLNKYQSYCRVSDHKEELFKLRKNEDESLEDYLDRFIFLSKRCGETTISVEILKTVFLKGLDDDARRSLDLMGKCDVSQLALEDICDLCRNFSRTREGIQKTNLF